MLNETAGHGGPGDPVHGVRVVRLMKHPAASLSTQMPPTRADEVRAPKPLPSWLHERPERDRAAERDDEPYDGDVAAERDALAHVDYGNWGDW